MKKPTPLRALFNQSYELEKTLRHFSNITSSELSTLLGFVLGELKNAELSDSLESARRAAERALFITKNLRYFSTHAHPVTERTDISQLVLDTVSNVEKDFSKIEFSVTVESSVFVVLDPAAFEQALLNLVFFSTSQIREGGIVHVNLQVLPQGIQMAVSSESAVSSGEASSKFVPTAAESFGTDSIATLGIQVARNIIELHSGKLQIFQSTSEGTQFLCELPFEPHLNQPHLYHEKRRFRRARVNLEGQLQGSGNSVLPCRISILSIGGCYAAMSQEWVERFKVEDRVLLRVFTETQSPIEISVARIANIHTQCDHSGLGIEFLELDSKAKNLLAALVKAHASYGV